MVLGLKPMGKPSTKKKIIIITSFGQNQGLVWSSDSSLWGNQVQKIIIITSFGQNQGLVWSSDSSLWGNQVKKNYYYYYYQFWTEPRPCMVLGLKPMGKPSTKLLLLQVLDRTKALYGPWTQTYGETNYLDEKRFEFCKMGYLIKMSVHFIHGLNVIKG